MVVIIINGYLRVKRKAAAIGEALENVKEVSGRQIKLNLKVTLQTRDATVTINRLISESVKR